MKTFILVFLIPLSFFNKPVAQSRNPAHCLSARPAINPLYEASHFNAVDTGGIYLLLSKGSRPLVSLIADFSKSPEMRFTVQDTAGHQKAQGLLQVINSNLIQWQLMDGTKPGRYTESKGEIWLPGSRQQ